MCVCVCVWRLWRPEAVLALLSDVVVGGETVRETRERQFNNAELRGNSYQGEMLFCQVSSKVKSGH